MKKMRKKSRDADSIEKKERTVHAYAWSSWLDEGKLGKLTVMELNKYLLHNNLPQKREKG